MDSFTELALIAAALVAFFLVGRRGQRRDDDPRVASTPQALRDHARLLDDPSSNLGRRRDDGVGGES